MRAGDKHIYKAVAMALVAGAVVLALGLASVEHEGNARLAGDRYALLTAVDAAAANASGSIAAAYRQALAVAASEQDLDGWPDAADIDQIDGYPVWHARDGRIEIRGGVQWGGFVGLLDETQSPIVGPYSTADGRDFVLLRLRRGEPANVEIGLAILLDELWSDSGLADLIAKGTDLSAFDPSGTLIYSTSPGALANPVRSTLQLAGVDWLLQASPRGGWRLLRDRLPTFVTAGLLAILFALAAFRLAMHPAQLRSELGALAQRLEAKDRNISELLIDREKLKTELQSSLTLDLVSGLQNRSSFVESLQQRLAQTRLTPDGGVYVATVRFPNLDRLGQSMGSTAAETVVSYGADVLRRNAGDPAAIGRTGDNELALFVGAADHENPRDVAEWLLRLFDDRVDVGRHVVYSPPTIGLARSSDGYEHALDLIGNSSLAATTAAENGREWDDFHPDSKDERVGVLQLEADLQHAVSNGELRLHFQPIMNLANLRISGFEALLRWRHPTEGWVGPDRFIPLAESMGQMHRISEWVVRQAVAYAKQWHGRWGQDLYVTVNLTPRDLNRELLNGLFDELRSAALPPECLRVEVTETAVVRDMRIAARLIGELSERGISVLLDDFGTGYSSLSYLRDLPFQFVKLDKSFIERLTVDARDFGLVRSIVSLIHYLGMECIAEGIETQDQLDLVEMASCDYGQGFLFSGPLTPAAVESTLDQQASTTKLASEA